MSELEELKADVVALRTEVEQWKAHVVEIMGVASRAQGLVEGVAEIQKVLNTSFERRLLALETRGRKQAASPPTYPVGMPVNPANPLYPVYTTTTVNVT